MPTTATPTPRFWANCSTAYFQALQANGAIQETIAVFPVAATEQHGPHLPLKVDSAIVDGVIAAALPYLSTDVPALFLPTQAVGFSPEHDRFPGTLTLKAETVLRLWTDVGDSVAASGIKKMVLFNSHGGQANFMDIVARDLRSRLGLMVFSVNWYGLPLAGPQGEDVNALFSEHEHRFGIHAGDIETSMMLALSPQHVEMQHAKKFASASETRAQQFSIVGNGKSAKLAWQMQDYNAAGAVGNAAVATKEKGEKVIDAAGRALAMLLAQIHQLPRNTVVV